MRAEGRFTSEQIRRLSTLLWVARAAVERASGKKRDAALNSVRLASSRLALALDAREHAAPDGAETPAAAAARSLGVDAREILRALVDDKTAPKRRGPALRELIRERLVEGDLAAMRATDLGVEVRAAMAGIPAGPPGARSRPRPTSASEVGRILDDPEPIEGISVGPEKNEGEGIAP